MHDFIGDKSKILAGIEPSRRRFDPCSNPKSKISRRELLRAGALGAAAVALGGQEALADNAANDPYGPFFIGIQSYSLRGFGFDAAIERTQKLGLRYWEAFQAHVPLTEDPAKQKEILARFKAAKIRLVSWGVEGFSSDEAAARRRFEFAKAMGIVTITADPAPDAFDMLDRLVARYRVNIAIHNHGPGARWEKIDQIQIALRDHHPRIGVCIDTGHLMRSGEDPVEAVRVFGKRVMAIHLKDVKKTANGYEFTELGKGDMDTTALFRALHRLKFRGLVALEYEEHADNPGPYLSLCLSATQDAIQKAIHQK
jgi:inosose dehydratase